MTGGKSVPLSRGFKIENLADSNDGSQLFSKDALSHAISGSVGGNVAMLAFYPLDQLVMRAQAAGKGKSKSPLQALQDVVKTEGVSGLYRGLNSTLFTLFAANFIYFYAFHLLRIICHKNKFIKKLIQTIGLSKPLLNLLLGTVAGVINVIFVQPLWVANARLKLQGAVDSNQIYTGDRYKGVVDVIWRIRKEEGVGKLWAGVSSSLLLCCNPAIQFAVYETVKRVLLKRAKKSVESLSSLEAFWLGAMSKWTATIVTYPLQVAQTRLRVQQKKSLLDSGNDVVNYNGTLHCIFEIYKREGRQGLYRGMETKLWHSTLISALMFLTYEKIQTGVSALVSKKTAVKVP